MPPSSSSQSAVGSAPLAGLKLLFLAVGFIRAGTLRIFYQTVNADFIRPTSCVDNAPPRWKSDAFTACTKRTNVDANRLRISKMLA